MDEGKSMTAKEKYIEFAQEHKEVCIYDSPWWLDTVCGGGTGMLFLQKRIIG